MPDILKQIVESRLQDVRAKTVPLSELQAQYRNRNDFRGFRAALQQSDASVSLPAVIAEIKRGSPARGLFAAGLDAGKAAKQYETGGAVCLSVLTEPYYFYGSMDSLIAARSSSRLPVLQKDFIVTEYQVYEAALYADAVLLIARCLETSLLKDLHDLATELRLDVLVEVFDEDDVKKIEPFHFPLIGINQRNLQTMDVAVGRADGLFSRFDSDQSVVAASGIKTRSDIEQLMQNGVSAFLIGESLSVSANPVVLLRTLIHGGSGAD
jgi:indole-3-glycerol phosphate synthase